MDSRNNILNINLLLNSINSKLPSQREWMILSAAIFFLYSKFFKVQEPGIIPIDAIEGHQLITFCFYAHNQLLTKVPKTLTLWGYKTKSQIIEVDFSINQSTCEPIPNRVGYICCYQLHRETTLVKHIVKRICSTSIIFLYSEQLRTTTCSFIELFAIIYTMSWWLQSIIDHLFAMFAINIHPTPVLCKEKSALFMKWNERIARIRIQQMCLFLKKNTQFTKFLICYL